MKIKRFKCQNGWIEITYTSGNIPVRATTSSGETVRNGIELRDEEIDAQAALVGGIMTHPEYGWMQIER
jgi:hypothetical protein